MYETQEELQSLQIVVNQSIDHASTFLRQSFQMPVHSLSARQLVHFWGGVQVIALATVTKNAEPRVAPIGALLFHGCFYIPTVLTALRTRHIMRRPGISFTCYQGNDLAIIVHGNATIVQPDHPHFVAVEAFQREMSEHSVREWGEGVFLQATAEALYTFARYPDLYPES